MNEEPIVKVENQILFKDMLENFNENVIIEVNSTDSGLIISDEFITRGQLYAEKTGTVFYITVIFYKDYSTMEETSGYITTVAAETEIQQDEQGNSYVNFALSITANEKLEVIDNAKSFIIQSNGKNLIICNRITEQIKTGISNSVIKLYYA